MKLDTFISGQKNEGFVLDVLPKTLDMFLQPLFSSLSESLEESELPLWTSIEKPDALKIYFQK